MSNNFILSFDYLLPEENNRGPFVIFCDSKAIRDEPINQSDLATIFKIRHRPAKENPEAGQIDKGRNQRERDIIPPSFHHKHEVTIVKIGNTITSYIDQEKIMETTNPLSGKWVVCLSGLGGWGSTRTIYFDNVNLTVIRMP